MTFHLTEDGFHDTAATALLRIVGARSPLAIPAFVHRLRSGAPLARQQAALALGALEEKAATSVGSLVEVALTADVRVAREAITALGRIGPAARAAVPALVELTKRRDEQLRRRAELALREVRGR